MKHSFVPGRCRNPRCRKPLVGGRTDWCNPQCRQQARAVWKAQSVVVEPDGSRVERHVRLLLAGALDLLNVVDPKGAPISLRDMDGWLQELQAAAFTSGVHAGVRSVSDGVAVVNPHKTS